MATLQDIEAKLAEYKTARGDREAKQNKHDQDVAALDAAIVAEEQSYDAWIAALEHEHQVEDELETLVEEYEPPPMPSEPAGRTKK